MTGRFRKLSIAVAALLLAAPAALAQDLKETFDQGYELLSRDRKEEALRQFQKVLSMEPTSEQAYELWKSTDHEVWMEMLRERGDFELIARRLMSLVDVARRERKDDAEAIRKLIGEMREAEALDRRAKIRELGANHGEYSVPYLLGWLGDTANEDNRLTAIQALTEMNTDVVLPLMAVLDAEDAFLRRNAVLVLKTIGDPRAAGALAAVARNDADGACRALAAEALAAMQASGDPCRDLCALGEAYHMRSSLVLADHQWSEVVWDWRDGKLVSTATPRALYPDSLSRQAYLRALAADPACSEAPTGIARAYAGMIASVESLAAAQVDVASWQAEVDGAHVALALTGPAALDGALAKCLGQNDSGTAIVLLRTLARQAHAPTAGMQAALRANDGAVRSEAAVALGQMAISGKTKASGELVSALGTVAGREIVRLAMVIDADAARATSVANALTQLGISTGTANTGVIGLSTLRRMPGIDAVVVADSLPDLTTHQVIEEVRAEPAFAKAPIFLVSANPEQAAEAFGETVAGVLADPANVAALEEAIAEDVNADRLRADELAARAATALMTLAGTGTDISSAADALAASLGRNDGVSVPAAYALAAAGRADHVPALTAVIGDAARSDAVREAAGRALASIFGRGGQPGDAIAVLHGVAHSDGPVAVRSAAAQALGNVSMSAEDRATQLREASAPKAAPAPSPDQE